MSAPPQPFAPHGPTAAVPQPARPPRLSRPAALLATLLVACGGGAGDPLPCVDCNVVLISIDTLRADHLGLYGYPRPTSPVLDALAAESVVFERYVNNGGRTLPVHMSMFTSLTPGVHQVLPQNDRSLEPERVTLAEVLAEHGRVTAAWTDSGWMQGRFGFSQGFGRFDDAGGHLRAILPKVLAWLDEPPAEPFFLFVHTYDVHSRREGYPYSCPGGFAESFGGRAGEEGAVAADGFDGCLVGPDGVTRCATTALHWLTDQRRRSPEFPVEDYLSPRDVEELRAAYDGCIRWVDQQLGLLFDRLRAAGLWDRTLLVVTSDHGEEFLDHGLLLHLNRSYEEMVRVPLIVRLPGGALGGRRVDGLGSAVDLMPTILDALGIAPPDQAMGASLLPLVRRGRVVRRAVHFYSGPGLPDLTTDRHKLIARGVRRFELYDIVADPEERRDLAAAEPGVLDDLLDEARERQRQDEASFRAFRAALEAEAPEKELSAEEIEALKALGYLN